ncbi:hypothetical protein [Micromonospora sp. CB01531]|uniref:hypothetical protein n=1 Tax=Micromonospora sp. CB01531 TaxID=1718947 RepID=UPI00093FD05C|nr:hypothetical protein [Micromonospora sp. CB01531]OKI45108.1 hypothetical protein A6A27_11865 [Micromonospora sp. CB01531]
MAEFATLDELKDRLDWTLDADEERIAQAALEDASDLACFYGKEWAAGAAPRMVRTLVLRACKRYMDNPAGYTQSRAGDETLGWNDAAGENAGTVHFTKDEQALLKTLAGKRPGIYSAAISAWGPQRKHTPGLVPDAGSNEPIQYFANDEDPW